MAVSITIPFRCSGAIQISHRQRSAIHMRATGGEPAERLLLYPNGLTFGMHADSVVGSADVMTGLVLYGSALHMGMRMRCGDIQLGSGKTLLYADTKTIGELDDMTLDHVPFE